VCFKFNFVNFLHLRPALSLATTAALDQPKGRPFCTIAVSLRNPLIYHSYFKL
jgi:hypothetical protein